MKLFGKFEAVKFPEENLIFITQGGYLYYIYNSKYKHWKKCCDAGNIHLTVANYPDVYRDELAAAMGGTFPEKETDFMKLCQPSMLCIRDMIDLLNEDYMKYMSDYSIYRAVHRFLSESNIYHKSYTEIRRLFSDSAKLQLDNKQILLKVKELSLVIIGRDIFKKEIGIVDGHDYSSYFWIMPVRIIDYSDTAGIDNVAEMRSNEISIEEDDVGKYLTPFLCKHFDEESEANKKRSSATGFEWYLTYNFFTLESMNKILQDIKDTVNALSLGSENEFTKELRRNTAAHELLRANESTEDNTEAELTETELLVDFYRRFIYRMEYMMTVGKEKGYDLISFMGP